MRFETVLRVLLTTVVAAPLCLAQQARITEVPPKGVSSRGIYKLPLTFEANRGQADSQVNFLSRGKGYTASLTADGMVLRLRTGSVAKEPAGSIQQASATLQFRLVGASKNPVPVGEDPQVGRVNYFIGKDPAQWHTNVPTYGKVRYKNVYPGIDLIYYGNNRQLEYDFAISPGTDPHQIQFEIRGASQIMLDKEGNLVLSTGIGDLHFQCPLVYQESNGQRVNVDGGYTIKDATHIGFQLSQYDSTKPVVIDPVLVYSTYLGGSGNDQASAIALDNNGSVYITGYTDSADFSPTTLGSVAAGVDHAFLAKLDPSGSSLVYADYIGGSSRDFGFALVLDSANDVYVTGSTESSDFPLVNPYQASLPGPYSGFVAKLSADGASLLYSTYLGGNSWDQPSSIAIDSFGELSVAGTTQSTNFPTVNAYQPTVSANQGGMYGFYGFLTKFNPSGTALAYSTYLGGNSNVIQSCWNGPCWPVPYNVVLGVALDAGGNAYVTGNTNTYNFPVTNDAYLTSDSSPQDGIVSFVSKFSSSGSLDYSTYFYASSGSQTQTTAIAVDSTGSAYVTGSAASDGTFPITSTSICDPGVYGPACGYAFVTKFDPTGSTLLYSTFLGPNNNAFPQGIVLDANNDAYVLASTASGSFSTVNGLEIYTNSSDILVVEIDPSASSELFATYLGGIGAEEPAGIAIDSNGDIYVAGSTDSADFPVTEQAFQKLPGGNTDAFVMKIGPNATPAFSASPAALQFAAQAVGSTAPAQTVLLRNMGSSALAISSIAANGDFLESDDCGNMVSAAGSCTMSITFTPKATGTRSGSILVQDNAVGSPHTINLSGIGLGAGATLNPASLTFADQPLTTSSSAQIATLTNSGNTTLNISSIQVTGDYVQTNNCQTQLQPNSSCTINVTFAPKVTGRRTGTMTISDSASSSPQTVTLTGNGSDFSLAGLPISETIISGATATYTLSVSPIGGSFSHSISLRCNGLPLQSTCSFSPEMVSPGTNSVSSKLTITTVEQSARALPATHHSSPVYAMLMNLQGLGFVGIVLASSRKRSKRLVIFIPLALLVLGMLFMSGCAGGTGTSVPRTPSSTTYTITVTGTYGALQHSLPLSLTLQ